MIPLIPHKALESTMKLPQLPELWGLRDISKFSALGRSQRFFFTLTDAFSKRYFPFEHGSRGEKTPTFTRPGLRINNLIPMHKTSHMWPGSDWHGSWWLTPFRTEIFCNSKGVCHYRLQPRFCNNNLSIGPNSDSVCFWNGFKQAWSCNCKNENKNGLLLPLS